MKTQLQAFSAIFRVELIATLFLAFFSHSPAVIHAQEMRYTITATTPSSGATNIAQNLQSGQTGSVCTSSNDGTVCNIMVGLGIDSSNSVKGVGYPVIDQSTVNSSNIRISSPSDSGLSAIWAGSGEGVGGDFYHDFKFYVTTSTNPYGTVLMPNATYTITLKGGSSGLKAKYQGTQTYSAYLPQDYTWSFTTANGSVPPRLAVQASSNPTGSTNTNSNSGSMEEKERAILLLQQQRQAQISPSPSPSPSSKPVVKKTIASPSPSPVVEPSESPSIEQEATPSPTPKPTVLQSVRNFFVRILSWFSRK